VKTAQKKLWLILIIFAVVLIVVSQLMRSIFTEKEQQTRTHIRTTLKKKFPKKAEQFMSTYGLKLFSNSNSLTENLKQAGDVILIHGLDEPGKVWMNLAPALVKNGFSVWIMTYPNDQPIAESAYFFLEQLKQHNGSQKKSISIVAHSMGGLVARDMLTNAAIAYTKKVQKGELPHIEKLIMVGTPNSGSELARFRAFTELRDQVINLFNENYHWLQSIFDGAGEAGLDLIPGSPFLENLNSRPHPKNVDMIVIAGVMSPVQKSQLEALTLTLEGKLEGSAQRALKTMTDLLDSASNKAGDGLVSVDSARISGVPLRIVQGTHLSIIRNISTTSQREPPALPIIIEHLLKPL